MGEAFEKLNDSNWSYWKLLMKALLVKKNLWDVIEGTKTLPARSLNMKPVQAFCRKQAEALAEITLHVEVLQLSFIQDNNPAVIWDVLTAVHQARSMATHLALHCRFLHLQKPEGPMQNFIAQACCLTHELTEIGININDEDIILVLTGGLPCSYDHFVITLNSTHASELTLNYVIRWK